ncbi:MAG TPA: FAD-dependent oxidoreductase, partial [Mycobacterium sp.]|nr:FAD-dependent oxidoreductase [Mycobacterium sp.]
MTGRSYCVVGGGISGLTAAYRLRAAVGDDATITLFDPADRLGGILRTELVGGRPMDVGAEAFVLRRPEMPALLAELDLSGRQLGTTGARPLIYSQQELHPLPAGTVVGIPSSASSVAGLVDEATVALIDAEPTRALDWRPGGDPAVAELVGDRFGVQTVTRSVDPLLCGVYAGSAATIGLRAAAPSVAAALDRGAASLTGAVRQGLSPATGAPVFGALDGCYQVLIDELVQRSGLCWIRAGVQRLDAAKPGWDLLDDAGARWHADAVILAVPASRLA